MGSGVLGLVEVRALVPTRSMMVRRFFSKAEITHLLHSNKRASFREVLMRLPEEGIPEERMLYA